MEMCYEGAMSLPSSYVTMNEEEMTYVEGGGWSRYKGREALATLTLMCGCAYAAFSLSKTACAAILATASTGIGLIASLGLALGVGAALTVGAYQCALAIVAADYMVESYKKTKSLSKSGYRACSYGVWTCSVFTGVKRL